ncbi:HAD family hydrolase [Nanoarchaeota archaeon]
MEKIKAIIFDMDGVLIASPKYAVKAFNILLGDEGLHLEKENVPKYLGRSLKDQLRLFKEDYGIKDHDLAEFSKEFGALQLKLMTEASVSNGGLKEFLRELKKQGFKIAIATSSADWRAERTLDILGVKEEFEVIVTSKDVKSHKPNPEVFLKAAEKLNVEPENCVVVEDAVNGIEAAKNAKMKAVALLTEYQTREDFKDADLIIESLYELNPQVIGEL